MLFISNKIKMEELIMQKTNTYKKKVELEKRVLLCVYRTARKNRYN